MSEEGGGVRFGRAVKGTHGILVCAAQCLDCDGGYRIAVDHTFFLEIITNSYTQMSTGQIGDIWIKSVECINVNNLVVIFFFLQFCKILPLGVY